MKKVNLQFVPVLRPDSRLDAVVETLESAYVNGRVILRRFRSGDQKTRDALAQYHLGGVWFQDLLESAAFRSTANELELPSPLPNLPPGTFYSGYEFEGAVTHMLLEGGAYVRPKIGDEKARTMSREFVDVLVGKQRRLEAIVLKLLGAWAWFFNVAWDSTFIVFLPRQGRWSMLCTTDTD